MSLLDVPTAYLIVGVLFLLAPASGWLVLGSGSFRAVALWCGGGLVFGMGMVLLGGRPVLPAWLSYPTAAGLIVLGLGMKASGLAEQLGQRWPLYGIVLTALVHAAVFEALRAADLSAWRFAWNAASISALFTVIGALAFRIAHQEGSKSARWLGIVYAMGAAYAGVRALGALAGEMDPNGVTPALSNVLTALVGLLVSIVGTMGFVGIFLDRARRQEIQAVADRARRDEAARLGAQIARMERLHVMNALSASLAHELNQPLSAILTNAQLAARMARNPETRGSHLQPLMTDIERDTQRASQVVQRARNFVRAGTTVREAVVLQQVVREVLDIAAGEIRGAGIAVDTALPAETVTVNADPVQLAQVVLNLLLNALQASPPPAAGGIDIRLWARAGVAVLTVRDHGQGIAPAYLPQIGTEFFTTKAQGTGLGLSIARQLVEQHGGQLVLRNAPDGGAEATLSLPCKVVPGG